MDSMILKVFSNLNDSMILCFCNSVIWCFSEHLFLYSILTFRDAVPLSKAIVIHSG